MKKITALLFSAVILPLCALEITPDKSDHLYKNGDEITFNIQLDKGRANTTFTVQLQGNRYIAPVRKLVSDENGRAKLVLTADRPGFIRARVNDNGKSASAAVAVDKEMILPARERPERFDRLWNRVRKNLELAPLRYESKEIPSNVKGFKTYEVTIFMPGEDVPPLYAVLTHPANAIPGRTAAMVYFHDSGIDKADPMYRSGMIVLSVNPLPVKHDGAQGETMKEGGAFYGYPLWGIDDLEKNCFLPMFKRVYRAVQFIREQPEWDGRSLIAVGSGQGGAQAIVAAGLDQKVSMCIALSPTLCNHGGFENGGESGWPRFHQDTAAYAGNPDKVLNMMDFIEVCFFAQMIRQAEVCVYAGYNDQLTPASAVFAAYNSIPSSNKAIFTAPKGDHKIPEDIEKEILKRINIHIRKQQSFR
jgi:cephalosporin-C deacetylase-like acetyl esterase